MCEFIGEKAKVLNMDVDNRPRLAVKLAMV